MTVITFATTNQGKVASLQKALNKVGLVDLTIDAQPLNIIEPQADTCETVAISKAEQAYALLRQPVLVDDSSFHITALGGFPGVYAKYMIDTLGAEGVVEFMKDKADRSAYFDGVLVYVDEAGEQHVFREAPYRGIISDKVHTMDKTTTWSELHKIFIPDGGDKVLGEMSADDYKKRRDGDSKYTQFVEWLKNSRE